MDIQKLKGHVPDAVIAQIPEVMEKFQINTPLRLCHFLAQCGHESGNFKAVNENLNYGAKGLLGLFKKYFPTEELAKKVLNTGLIEPLEIIQNLPKIHYDNIVKIISDILYETIHKSKEANQLKIYHFLTTFHSYMSRNELLELGIKPSDHFVKTQLALAMSHGVTLTLCKDDYINLTDQVLNEIFHTKFLDLSSF